MILWISFSHGCLIKLLEALPENTLIERNKSIRNDYGRIENALFFELFRFVREYEPTFELGFRNYADIEQYAEAAEYELYYPFFRHTGYRAG